MLQNGQQSEEEFSNLTSKKAEIEAAGSDNYLMGIEMGGQPNMSEQPLESETSEVIDDMDVMDDFDIYENPDYSKRDVEMEDAEFANKWESVPNSFKKYLDDSFVKDPYRYSPEGKDEEDEEWEPEYNVLSSKPSKFMDSEVEDDMEDMEEIEEMEDSSVSYSLYNTDAEEEEDQTFSDAQMYAIVIPGYNDELSNQKVIVNKSTFENAMLDEAIEIEFDGMYDFVPKSALRLI
jgi:hypothetical protein